MAKRDDDVEEVDAEDAPKKGKKGKSENIGDILDSVSEQSHLAPVDISRGKYVHNTFSSGLLSFDLILGGGYGIGRWTSLFGPSQSGKSTTLYTGMSLMQHSKVPLIVFDHEGSIDPTYMRFLGVKLQKSKGFYNIPADVGEHTYRYIRRVLKKMPDVDRKELTLPTVVFYIDSLKAMVAEAMDEDDEKNPMGMAARMHRTYMPAVRSLLRRKGAAIVATNQISLSPMAYGNPETEPGGNAVQFYPDIRVRIGRHAPRKGDPGVTSGIKIYGGGYVKEESIFPDGGEDKFAWTTMRTVKNRQFAPYQEAEMRLNLGRGMDPIYDAYSFLSMTGQIDMKKGQKIVLDLDGWKGLNGVKNGKTLEWFDFGRLSATPDFRDYLRGQIKDNTAFDQYFQVTVGRSSLEETLKGRDPLAIYNVEKKGKKKDKEEKKHKKAA